MTKKLLLLISSTIFASLLFVPVTLAQTQPPHPFNNNKTPQLGYVDTTNINLLRNSSFESFTNKAPRQWQYMFSSKEENTKVTQEGVLTGSYGLKFTGSSNGHFGIMQPVSNMIENRAYTYTAFVKTINVPEDTTIRLAFWDPINNKYASI